MVYYDITILYIYTYISDRYIIIYKWYIYIVVYQNYKHYMFTMGIITMCLIYIYDRIPQNGPQGHNRL